MACGARLGDARGEGRRFDRSEEQCTPLLSPVAAYHAATIHAAETCSQAKQSPIPMDCCKMLLTELLLGPAKGWWQLSAVGQDGATLVSYDERPP